MICEICWILVYYIESDKNDTERISRIVGLDVMTTILPFLESQENKIIRPLLQLLIIITATNEEFFNHLIDDAVINNLKRNLKSDLKILRSDSCQVIQNLANAGSEIYARVFRPDIIDILINLALNDPSAQVKAYAINALYKFIEFAGVSSINYLLVNCDLLAVLFTCLDKHIDSIQMNALDCIELLLHFADLVQHPGEANEIVSAIIQKGGLERIEVLCQSNNNVTAVLANKIISQYFSS